MKIRERLNAIRARLRQRLFSHTVFDAAEFNCLTIEYWKDMGPKYDGHLDTTNEVPCFIGVNPDLSKREQVYVIAREIARLLQQRHVKSMIFGQPWKWELLAAAPAETRDLIYRLDLEWRTYMIMFWHASKDDFFGYYRQNRRKYWAIFNGDSIASFIFFKLRIKRSMWGFYSAVATAKRNPTAQIS
jgi:hypothetical protein